MIDHIGQDLIYLASASPRRAELLERMGLPFTVKPVDIIEPMSNTNPKKLAKDLSELKMKAFIQENKKLNPKWVITCDTFVHFKHQNLGKPTDKNEAIKMISRLSGNRHAVYTGLTLYSGINNQFSTKIVTTNVIFEKLTSQKIEWYIQTKEWEGVAGSYRIQEKGEALITKIVGSYSNVIGLPVNQLFQMLTKAGYFTRKDYENS